MRQDAILQRAVDNIRQQECSIQEAWGTLSPPADAKTALAKNSRELAGRVGRPAPATPLSRYTEFGGNVGEMIDRGGWGCWILDATGHLAASKPSTSTSTPQLNAMLN